MKKNEELLHSIGDIDEKYIENAKPKNIQKKKVVWISAFSAAACLVGTIGLMYYFVFRPLNHINNPGDSSEVITTEVTETSEPPHTEENEYESEYPDIKIIDINHLKEHSGIDVYNNSKIRAIRSNGENLFIQDVHQSTMENWCLCAEISSLDKKIVFTDINNITMNEIYSSDACFNDNYLYILLHGQLYSVSLETDEIISQKGGFHFEMDLSGSSECLGVDTDGNVYMESGEYIDDGYVNKIIKYSPELEVIAEYQTYNSIPFEHIINFDDMYIDENDVLFCVYDNDKTVRINLSDEKISSDEEVLENKAGWYINNYDQKPLKTYSSRYLKDNSKEGSRWIDGSINCIDSVVQLSVNAGCETTGFYKLDQSGENLTEYSMSEKCSPICYGFSLNGNDDIISAFSNESDGALTDYIIKYNMVSENSDSQQIGRNKYYTDSDVISINDFNTDNDDNYYISYMLSDELEGGPSDYYPLISRYSKNNYDEQVTVKITEDDAEDLYLSKTQIFIKDNEPYVIAVLRNGKKSIIYKPDFDNKTYSKVAEVSGKLFSQSDGTLLCVMNDTLYSYELEYGKMAEIFKFPQDVLSSGNDGDNIQKINETSYAYIKGLAEPQSSQESETQLYLLTIN